MNNQTLLELVNVAIGLPKDSWWHYYCENGVQELDRLTCHHKQYELQINEIFHSEKPHIHTVDLTSVILENGYTWFLQQYGSEHALELFAAPGSVVRMGPNDTHWIPRQAKRSISFCIFELQTRWDTYYPKLVQEEFNRIYDAAITSLIRFQNEFVK